MTSHSDSEELFNLADFEGIEVSISLENITANTGVKDHIQVFGDLGLEKFDSLSRIRLMEFLDDGVSLDVPAKIGAMGHSVRLTFDVIGVQLPFAFEAKGQIAGIQSISPERDKFIIKFSDYETRFFEALKNLYADRQKQIEDFIFQIKG